MAAAVVTCLVALASVRAQPAAADKQRSGGTDTQTSGGADKPKSGGADKQKSGGADKNRPVVTQQLDLRVIVSPAPGSGAKLRYRGTFSGAPLGHGTVTETTKLGTGDAVITYVLTTSTGTVRGSGTVTLSYSGSKVSYNGTATIAKGTGAYRTMRATGLRISGSSEVNSQRTALRLTGLITS